MSQPLPDPAGTGSAPVFCPAEPVAERLAAIITALVAELAVVRERVDTLERLLAAQGVLPAEAVEGFQPDAVAESARQAWRQQYLQRIFAGLKAEADALAADTTSGPTRQP